MHKKYSWMSSFETRNDLKDFKEDALLLFALSLKFDIDDIVSLASTDLTEGGDDKKADLIHINAEEEYAVIAQTTISSNWDKSEAPANKASDLNTAVSWLLNMPVSEIPEKIKPKAIELRNAINNGEIKTLYIWYVHNLPESQNVKNELTAVEHSAKSAIDSRYPDMAEQIEVQAVEVGMNIIEDWYISLSRPILVTDDFEISISGGYTVNEQDWEAYITSIPIKWLYEKYKSYNDNIFSANIRGYLGIRKNDVNINNKIKETATSDPGHFWVFNNGITALTHSFEQISDESGMKIKIKGISIVNGAQTTGAVGNLDKEPDPEAKVQVRFVKCSNAGTIEDIVRYNNSQNRITAPDFRSGDSVQTRLVNEFKNIHGIRYLSRRGVDGNAVTRGDNILASITAGQALAAMHGDPDVAYHSKTYIWEDNSTYTKYFNENTTAKHLLFSYSLLRAIEDKKIELVAKTKNGGLTQDEDKQLVFFRERGSIILFTSAIASSLEAFINRKIPNKFKITFRKELTLEDAIKIWQPIINISSSFCENLMDGFSNGLKNRENVSKAINIFNNLINATKEANKIIFNNFANEVIIQ